MDLSAIRNRFPLLTKKTYLNSCSYGALADTVRAAKIQYLDDRDALGACWEQWVDTQERLRQLTAGVLGVQPTEIALSASLSSALNAFVSCLDFMGPRRKIVVTSHDFPTTAHIWHAQKRLGAEVCCIEIDDCETAQSATDRISAAIDSSTMLVCVPYVCYRNGRRVDVESIAEAARRKGAISVIDAYQAVGTMPVVPHQLNVDVLLGGYLKYLLGSAGVGFMFVRGDLVRQLVPRASGWFAQEDIHAMNIADNVPADSARRFESGTPNVSGMAACVAGLEIIHAVGIDAIDRQNQVLTNLIKQQAARRGWSSATADWPHGAMIALRSTDMSLLVEKLAAEDVVVSCRDDNIRISPHFYNNEGDIERLFAVLDNNARLMVSA